MSIRALTFLLLLGLASWVEAKSPLAVPSWELGGSYNGRYFSNGLDHWADVEALYRLNRHWGISAQGATQLGDLGFIGTMGMRWYPDGRIGRIGSENWLEISGGEILRRTGNPQDPGCTNCDTWLYGPTLSLTYGRDILPWDEATWGMRIGIFAGVAFGNVLFRQNVGLFGIDQTRKGWLIVGFQAGIFHLVMKENEKN